MTKEALIAFGLTEEQAEKAIQLHNAAMEGYVPKGTYDVLKAENENLVATVNSNKTELEKLKKFEGTNAELAAKIEKLQGEATTKETEYKEQLEKLRKVNAVELALLAGENKPHDLQLVKGLIDLSLIKLDGDKVVSGLKEQVESLQKINLSCLNLRIILEILVAIHRGTVIPIKKSLQQVKISVNL